MHCSCLDRGCWGCFVVSGRLSFIINRQLLLRYTREKEAGRERGVLMSTQAVSLVWRLCPRVALTARSSPGNAGRWMFLWQRQPQRQQQELIQVSSVHSVGGPADWVETGWMVCTWCSNSKDTVCYDTHMPYKVSSAPTLIVCRKRVKNHFSPLFAFLTVFSTVARQFCTTSLSINQSVPL